MIWIFLGAPGAGKGTQAVRLAEELGVPHISTGDLLRRAIADEDELGKRARSYIEAGELVPDELLLELVRSVLASSETARGCILDGYPRNLAQAESLDEILASLGRKLTGVVSLQVAEETLVARIAGRRSDEARADDDEETMRTRLRVYREQTAPLEDYYRKRGCLREVHGEGTIDEVADRVRRVVRESPAGERA
jgi:adenylate kinase